MSNHRKRAAQPGAEPEGGQLGPDRAEASPVWQKAEGLLRETVPAAATVVVALSGGLDSMVLFRIMERLRIQHRWNLVVAHFNHKLRGAESEADQCLVEEEARKAGVLCLTESAEVREISAASGESVEMAARRLRHAFLARAAASAGSTVIVTGHHAGDQVELFFLRLLRGAGAEGLGGMSPLSVSPADRKCRLLRPFLEVGKEELELFAREQQVSYREDLSNAALEYQRNMIRHKLLPLLRREYQPALDAVVLRTMQLLKEDAACIEALESGFSGPFDEAPAAVQRLRLARALIRAGLPPAFDRIERLRLSESPVMCPGGQVVRRTAEGELLLVDSRRLDFSAQALAATLEGTAGEILAADLKISWRLVSPARPESLAGSPRGQERFDAEAVGREILLRHWRPGDRFHPIGMGADVKLQDLFTNLKVPADERRRRAVGVTARGELFWVEGLRISERFKVRPETERMLEWSWTREERGM